MSQKKPLLAAFDFDWTVIDDDSDHWVINKLSETQAAKMKELSGKVQWTDLMGMLLKGLHAEGVTSEDIIKKLGEIPFNPAMVGVFETIKAAGGDIIIVSDANTIFIEEILILTFDRPKNIRHFITEIVTNPGTWDSSGCLTVQRRIKSTDAPHNCQSICAINLCKGNEMTIRFEGYERFIYGGDGRNDYCPMTKLSTADAVFPRRGHSLEKYLTSNKLSIEAITASIHWWSSSEDLLAAVKTVLA